ncbi:hypothetical protein H4582DRAFT_2104684, partial [Lactarius indigo]
MPNGPPNYCFSKLVLQPWQINTLLSLVANVGLCFFLIGLEIDAANIRHNVRLSATITATGVITPFGLGAALAVLLYKHFVDSSQVSYTHFILFTGVAYSITDFLVLYRILTELKLLDTTIGIVVLLPVLVTMSLDGHYSPSVSRLSMLEVDSPHYSVGLYWMDPPHVTPHPQGVILVRSRNRLYRNGPIMLFISATVSILFGPAFFTDVTGVHAIFGTFPTGIIVPRDGGLAIVLTEKLEDMVPVIFLLPYFTLSSLLTDLAS